MLRWQFRPRAVQPVEGHASGIHVLVLKPLSFYLKLDLSAGLITVFDTLQSDVDVSEDNDRFGRSGYIFVPKASDYHLGILVRVSTGDSYVGNVGEVGHLFRRDCCLKPIAVG